MVKFFFRQQQDHRYGDKETLLNEVTFGYNNLLTYMLFACPKHRDQRVEMNPNELGRLAGYMAHQIKYVRTPLSPTEKRLKTV